MLVQVDVDLGGRRLAARLLQAEMLVLELTLHARTRAGLSAALAAVEAWRAEPAGLRATLVAVPASAAQ